MSQRIRAGLAGQLIGGVAQPFSLPLCYPRYDTVKNFRIIFFNVFPISTQNYPDGRPVASESAAGMGGFVKESAFADHCSHGQGRKMGGRAMQPSNDLHLSLLDDSGPEPGGRFMEQIFARFKYFSFSFSEYVRQVDLGNSGGSRCGVNQIFKQ